MPLTSNFIGEFLILYGLIATANSTLVIFISFAIFACAIYSIWIYNKIIFGLPNYKFVNYLSDLSKSEFMIMVPIILGTILIGTYPVLFFNLFISNLHYYFNFII